MEASAIGTAIVAVGLSLLAAPIVRWFMKLFETRKLLATTSIPGPPAPSALKGHVEALVSDKVHETFSDWTDTYGPVFRLQMLNSFAVVVTDPAAVSKLLRKGSPDYAPKNTDLYAPLELGTFPQVHNIVTSADNTYWKAVRTGLAPCFSISNLKKLFPRLQALTAAALEVVGAAAAGGQEVDVADLAKRVTSDVMGSMLLDQDFGGMEMRSDPYMEAFNEMLVESHAHFSNPFRRYLWWGDAARGKAIRHLHDLQLERKVAAAFKAPPAEHTIAGHLFKVKDPATGRPLTMPQLKAELGIVLGAGFETTSHAITWTLAALATHPGVQAKLAEELSAAGLTSRGFDWGDLARLPYLNAVIKETLRLFSPASMGTSRTAEKDMVICGHTVPKGCWVMIPMGPIGTSTHTYGPNARCFVPERWLAGPGAAAAAARGADSLADGAAGAGDSEEGPSAAAAACAGGPPDPVTFSLGPRDCVGQTLAKMELQVVVASLVSRFDFTPGAALQRAVDKQLAAVGVKGGGGQQEQQQQQAAVIKGVLDLAQYHVTLQPKAGMLLTAHPRS